jgi:hypothetical protein
VEDYFSKIIFLNVSYTTQLRLHNRWTLIFHGGRGLCFNAHVIVDLETKNAILIVTNSEVGHTHPNSQILKMHKKIKRHYSDRVDLPFFY